MAKLTPMKAIRAKCVECCGGSVYEPKNCTITGCALWEYRLGHRPQADATKEPQDDPNARDAAL